MILLRLAIKVVGAVVALVVLYVAITFAQVWWASRQSDDSPASAIVVMGAAQWNGQPSPVLRGRLDHAADLYARGVAPEIIVAGGKQVGDVKTQGLVGFEYLRSKGVPETAVLIEVDGRDSYEELAAARNILDERKLGRDVVIVTDPYHSYRAAAIASEVGLKPHVSPTGAGSSMNDLVRETGGVAIGRLLGYRRLSALH